MTDQQHTTDYDADLKLERYRIIEEIGKGGMGTVFRGVQLALNREVAIKMLNPELTENPQLVARFIQEANVIASLNHPRIVTIYDILEVDGRHFMIMEFVRGSTLEDLRRRHGMLLINQACRLCCQVLEGLEAAHNKNIIHRDIKPENIMVLPSLDVKVMDFGIARLTSGSNVKTQTGRALGTPLYMAPEQIMARNMDARTDLYALGVVLYTLVCGRPPFENSSAIILARMHLQERPPAPEIHNPRIGKALSDFLLQAMAKDPSERFQSAAVMRARVDQFYREYLEQESKESDASLEATVADAVASQTARSPLAVGGASLSATVAESPESAPTEFAAVEPYGAPPSPDPATPPPGETGPSPSFQPRDFPSFGASAPTVDAPTESTPSSPTPRPPSDDQPISGTSAAPIAPAFGQGGQKMLSLNEVAGIKPKKKADQIYEASHDSWLGSFVSRARIGRLRDWEAALLGFVTPGIYSVLTSHKKEKIRLGWLIFATSLLIFALPFALLGQWIYRSYYALRTLLLNQDEEPITQVRDWFQRKHEAVAIWLAVFLFGSIAFAYTGSRYQTPRIVAKYEERILAEARQRSRDDRDAQIQRARELAMAPVTPTPTIAPPPPRSSSEREPTPAVERVRLTPLPTATPTPTPRPIPTIPALEDVRPKEVVQGKPSEDVGRPPTSIGGPHPLPEVTPFTTVAPPPRETPLSPTADTSKDPLAQMPDKERTEQILSQTEPQIPAVLRDPDPSLLAAKEVDPLPDSFSDQPTELAAQVLMFRDEQAYDDFRLIDGIEKLRETAPRSEETRIALMYLGIDLYEKEPGTYKRFLEDKLLEPWDKLFSDQRASGAVKNGSLFVKAAGLHAGEYARTQITEKLNAAIGRDQTDAIIELLNVQKLPPRMNGVALGVKSNDPALGPHLAASLRFPDSRYYDDVFRWLSNYGRGDAIPVLMGIQKTGVGDLSYRNGRSKLRIVINACRKNDTP